MHYLHYLCLHAIRFGSSLFARYSITVLTNAHFLTRAGCFLSTLLVSVGAWWLISLIYRSCSMDVLS
jgi:hypothetical protein